ncbi:MAG: DUF4198 domain-containing protein [Gammaproteobacteria bacterium]|nr:DUF4198 domain-containing protein [Gammaproteobacteria bacterium]
MKNINQTALYLLILAVATVAAPVSAHEMFLKPENSRQTPDSPQVLRLINGTFDKSENAITRDRMADVSIVANGKVTKPRPSDWRDDENSSYLNYNSGEAGTHVIGVSTKPRIITMSADDFIAYLKHDGVLDTLATFQANNTLAEVRERYSKHIRTIVQVGDERTDSYAAKLGYPVEIILDKNPYKLRFGDDIGFQVLHNGEPVRGQLVRASYEGFHGHDDSGGHINSYEMRTDEDGRARFLLNNKALWYISLIHMEKIDDPDADYESNWATITFKVD